jgi:hypothetical protein
MIAKCECSNCGVNIEFDTDSFIESGKTASKIFGQNVTCPNCHKPTILILPNNSTAQAEKSEDINKSKIEDTLEFIGGIFLFLGLISAGAAAIALAIINGNSYNAENQTQDNIILIVAGVISAIQGFVLNALFRAFAEIIRLLRKLVAKT